jgi:hypothetical protein
MQIRQVAMTNNDQLPATLGILANNGHIPDKCYSFVPCSGRDDADTSIHSRQTDADTLHPQTSHWSVTAQVL